MTIYGVDPGSEHSAMVIYDADQRKVACADDLPNSEMRACLRLSGAEGATVVCEWIASYGMPVGAEVFTTCYWVGVFAAEVERGGGRMLLLPRPDVKLHMCHSRRAKDANVRQALLDRFGPGRQTAVGTKKAPGPLYGVSNHAWAALAVAVTQADRMGADVTISSLEG